MVLITHIVLALSSLVIASFAWLTPSALKLRVSQFFVAATLSSGTYLVISTHSNMISACVSGLAYLAFVAVLLIHANHKLANEKV
jgi:hypothetical protein